MTLLQQMYYHYYYFFSQLLCCGLSSVSSLCCLATRRVNKISTVKVFSSSVKINERFGTAIAIWVFSIRSYSSTTGFIVISRSQNEKRCKNLPKQQGLWRTSQNRRKQFFLQTEICVKNLALANVNCSISDILDKYSPNQFTIYQQPTDIYRNSYSLLVYFVVLTQFVLVFNA